jgi:hypothetical protein
MAIKRFLLPLSILCIFSLFLPLCYTSASPAITPRPATRKAEAWSPAFGDDAFVYYQDHDGVRCRPATTEEAQAIAGRDSNIELQVLSSNDVSAQAAGDLSIVLRGTAQLDQFPQARQCFLNAAERWRSLIQVHAAITIIIDVDFGPNRFGTPFPADVLGSTGIQALINPSGYPATRNSLTAMADNSQETNLYNSLPTGTLPTDVGSTAGVVASSALLRALGHISPIADPPSETPQFGNPPSIGFNSNFAFDFDPSDGIDADKTDFDAVATHEIGHALGFSSRVGALEMDPTVTRAVSVLDVFRFRPGVTLSTFTAAPRTLSSGGNQVFFAGAGEIALSTGRPNGSGGDGFQASHWKNGPAGGSLGIMDPALSLGDRITISQNDLLAYDAMGYLLRSGGGGGSSAPGIGSLSASLQGDLLTLTGQATDGQGDITQAQTTLLNSSGGVVAQNSPFAVNFGGQTSLSFNLDVAGLNGFPAATKVGLVLIDQQGNQSASVTADFSEADSGGPTVRSASYAGKLKIKGSGLIGQLEIEINGVVVATKENEANKKIKIGGSTLTLNIRPGDNRIRVRNGNLRSNILVTPLL